MKQRRWKWRERQTLIPPREEENEVCRGKAKTPQNSQRKKGKERARQEGGDGGSGTDKRTRGAVGGVRRGGRGRVSVQARRRESQLCGDRQMGILCLKTGENHLLEIRPTPASPAAQWAQQPQPPAALNWHREGPNHQQPKSRDLHNFQGHCTCLHQLKPAWA